MEAAQGALFRAGSDDRLSRNISDLGHEPRSGHIVCPHWVSPGSHRSLNRLDNKWRLWPEASCCSAFSPQECTASLPQAISCQWIQTGWSSRELFWVVILSKFLLRWQWCVTCFSTEVGVTGDPVAFVGWRLGLYIMDRYFILVFCVFLYLRGCTVV